MDVQPHPHTPDREGKVGGGMFDPPPGNPRQIMNYATVTDLDAALGGKLLGERMEVGAHGWMRVIADPDGNVLALWQFKPQPAAKKKPAPKKKR